jgi:3-hydroxyisobutyrate dehydrogenase-like beta-hydroxyacid dehydrogenase
VRPLLDAIGQRTWLLGVEPHQANVAKLAINFLVASAIEAMAEAATLAERHEIDPAKLMEVITGTLFAAPAYATYGKLIIEKEFKPGFKVALGLKDMRLALAAGEAAQLTFQKFRRDNDLWALGRRCTAKLKAGRA